MHQEAQQQNITLVRKPRGADNQFLPPAYSTRGLEMKWDSRVNAWEIVTLTGRVEFRIVRIVNGKPLITFYVGDTEPATDDLSRRVAEWMAELLAGGEDLGMWNGPSTSEGVETGTPEDHADMVPREEFDRAARLITWMSKYIGSMAPGDYPDCYADLNNHMVFVHQLDSGEMKK